MKNIKTELKESLTKSAKELGEEEFEREGSKKEKLFDGNIAQQLLFTNLTKVVEKGEKRAFTPEDLFEVPEEFKYACFGKFKKFIKIKGNRFKGDFLGLVLTFFAKDLRLPMFLSALK